MECGCGKDKFIQASFPEGEVDLALIEELLQNNQEDSGNLIAVLQGAQKVYGYLPRLALSHIARRMGVKPARVFGVATFYTQFRFTPVGKYLILLCEGTACHVNGAERIKTALGDELNIEAGQTTADRLFTLDTAACLGCCSLAPVMMINGQAYGPLTPDKARSIIRSIYKREGQLREGAEEK